MKTNKPIYRLDNPIKHYIWGDKMMLPNLLQQENTAQQPWAELWMGTHPAGESLVIEADKKRTLKELVASDAPYFLGDDALKLFGADLPFLYKVLAIDAPLSLQVHPSKVQAEAGFAHENAAGIALDDPKRSYQDANHKTELICAYDDNVWALVGFQPYSDIISNLRKLQHSTIDSQLKDFEQSPSASTWCAFLKKLLMLEETTKVEIITKALQLATTSSSPNYRWLATLCRRYPTDMAALAPLYMNVVHLPKGKALFVQAGTLHAYLSGCGIEIMALSDNVVRFGLTPKYIDMASLESIVQFSPTSVELVEASPTTGNFETTCSEFLLRRVQLELQKPYLLPAANAAQILLCMSGKLDIIDNTQTVVLSLQQGDSIFIPYSAGDYTFSGSADIFIATTPS
jgi:mannose-6-phosphate isomerase